MAVVGEILLWFGGASLLVIAIAAAAYDKEKKDTEDSLFTGICLAVPILFCALGYRLMTL